MTAATGTLLLDRRQVAALLGLGECIDAVEDAFRDLATGRAGTPRILDLPVRDGGYHVKAAALDRCGRSYVAIKSNANYPANPTERGLPTIQGTIALHDGRDGRPLALLDSTEITALRTAAATAVAARHLARPDASVVGVLGCGLQGRVQLRALAEVLPVTRVVAWDADPAAAGRYAAEMAAELDLDVEAARAPCAAVQAAHVAVTCTPSTRPFVAASDLRPGLFLAAVGADAETKRELERGVLAASRVVVDVLDQCATIGELHHALAEGSMEPDDVHGDLGQVVAGHVPGRRSDLQVFVFDSTGTAIQDVAAAIIVYERAIERGVGMRFDFMGRKEEPAALRSWAP